MKRIFVLALPLLLMGCGAGHELAFDYWRGLPPETTTMLSQGELPFDKDKVFLALSDVLDNGPFLRWNYEDNDMTGGLISATANPTMEIKATIVDAGGDSANAKVKVKIEFPRGAVSGEKSVWVSDKDDMRVTAYDLQFSQRTDWHSVMSQYSLDPNYWISAVYRDLTDKTEVPFEIKEAGSNPAPQMSPTSAAAAPASPAPLSPTVKPAP
jgi:hypothetical protein